MSAEAVHFEAQPIDCETLRATEFPWTAETTYLNHASIGPLPERTRLALDAFNRRRSMPFNLPDRDLFALMNTSRRLISDLLSVSPEEIGLSVNTGYGLSVIARALPLEPRRPRAGERQGVPRQRVSVDAPQRDRDRDGACADHAGRLAGRTKTARAAVRSSSPGARDLTGPVQQRLPGGPGRALRGDPANRGLSRGGRDPGRGPDPAGPSRGEVDVLACGARSGCCRPGDPGSSMCVAS